ncbi:MAG: PLDc N-terminal domain-containing protein [Candidatus Omnitrophica bacterium]|nr:PLDc N-terminal domain-containing protein [Candidatus Omnitrophota bacterium]
MSGLLGFVILVLDILVIIDCVKSPKPTGQKALWIILIIVLPLIGLILYYFLGRKK